MNKFTLNVMLAFVVVGVGGFAACGEDAGTKGGGGDSGGAGGSSMSEGPGANGGGNKNDGGKKNNDGGNNSGGNANDGGNDAGGGGVGGDSGSGGSGGGASECMDQPTEGACRSCCDGLFSSSAKGLHTAMLLRCGCKQNSQCFDVCGAEEGCDQPGEPPSAPCKACLDDVDKDAACFVVAADDCAESHAQCDDAIDCLTSCN